MARNLNKSRMRYTRILAGLALLFGIFGAGKFDSGSVPHELMRFTGYVLLCICAVGRVYSTAFIGGGKNKELITWGPYSVCRNPLYFFSLCGAAGLGFATTSLIVTAVLFLGFLIIYIDLIAREERFLENEFGKTFRDFKARVPRLLPDLTLYHCPGALTFQPKFFNFAIRDAVWWFAPLPLFYLADLLQQKSLITPMMRLF